MNPSLDNPKSYVFLCSIRLFAHTECSSVSIASMYLDWWKNAGTVEVDGHISSAPSPQFQLTYQSVQCKNTTLAGNTLHTYVFNFRSTLPDDFQLDPSTPRLIKSYPVVAQIIQANTMARHHLSHMCSHQANIMQQETTQDRIIHQNKIPHDKLVILDQTSHPSALIQCKDAIM